MMIILLFFPRATLCQRWVLTRRLFLTRATSYYKEIRVLPKIRVFPSGIKSQTLDFELCLPRHVDHRNVLPVRFDKVDIR